jgi:hypothetical protein
MSDAGAQRAVAGGNASAVERKERELDPHLVWVMLLIVIALVLRR